jgi:hypothetical protein
MVSFFIKAIKVHCMLLRSINPLLTLEKIAFFRKAASNDIKGRLVFNRILFNKAKHHIRDVQLELTIQSKPKSDKAVINNDTQLEENGQE